MNLSTVIKVYHLLILVLTTFSDEGYILRVLCDVLFQ